jgi:TfoX/Sxy family transcriptional regulator of competence genes
LSGFAEVIDAFGGEPAVEVSRMFGSDAIKVRGKVFAMHVKDRLVVKLSGRRAEGLVAAGTATAFDPGHGRPMKQWVAIGPEHEWVPLAREAFLFVTT